MITFDELAFSEDLQKLSIVCTLDTTTSPNACIKNIYLEYYKNRSALLAPSDKALHLFSDEGSQVPVTEVSLEVNATDINIGNIGVETFMGGLFYVLVHWQDAEEHEYFDAGAVLDWKYVYSLGMNYVSKFTNACKRGRCDIPEDLEQLVLVVHALELAIKARDVDQLDLLWGRFINFSAGNNVSQCNCG